MNKLELDLEGRLTLKGKVVNAKPIGKPRVLWEVEGMPKAREMELDQTMQSFGQSVATNKNEIPDSYLEGDSITQDKKVYTPVQFYKLESS